MQDATCILHFYFLKSERAAQLGADAGIVDPDDAEFLSSLVLKAVQDALNGAKNMAEAEMRKVTGGLGFPM